jgi:hypothetical protein
MVEINYACSLGFLCHTSELLKKIIIKGVLIHLIGFFQIIILLYIV